MSVLEGENYLFGMLTDKYLKFLNIPLLPVALLGIGRFKKTRNCNPTGAYVRYVRISVARLLGWKFQLQRHSLSS